MKWLKKIETKFKGKEVPEVEEYKLKDSEMEKLSASFVSRDEKYIASLGNGYIMNYLANKSVKKGFAFITDKRVYFKGSCLSGTGKKLVKTNEERTVDVKNITGSGFTYHRYLGILVALFISVLVTLAGVVGTATLSCETVWGNVLGVLRWNLPIYKECKELKGIWKGISDKSDEIEVDYYESVSIWASGVVRYDDHDYRVEIGKNDNRTYCSLRGGDIDDRFYFSDYWGLLDDKVVESFCTFSYNNAEEYWADSDRKYGTNIYFADDGAVHIATDLDGYYRYLLEVAIEYRVDTIDEDEMWEYDEYSYNIVEIVLLSLASVLSMALFLSLTVICCIGIKTYLLKRKTLFRIEYAGGCIAFNVSFYAKTEIDDFQKQLRRAKDMAEESTNIKVIPTETPIETVTQNNAVDDLRKYAELLKEGLITQEEYDAMKKKVLGL